MSALSSPNLRGAPGPGAASLAADQTDGDVFWQRPLPALLQQLGSRPEGLASEEAQARLATVGENVLRARVRRALALDFLTRLHSPLVLLLLVACGVSAVMGDAASA